MKNVTYISAGAGTGKTYRLTHLLSDHIKGYTIDKDGVRTDLEKVNPEQVILTTFTIKAAHEFRERAKGVLYSEGLYNEASRLDLARIGTVHSICLLFVKKYWYAINLSPALNVISDESRDFFIGQSLAGLPTNEEIRKLNAFRDQFEVVSSLDPNDPSSPKLPDYGFWKRDLTDIIKKAETFDISDFDASRIFSKKQVGLYYSETVVPSEANVINVLNELCKAINDFRPRNEEKRQEKAIRLNALADQIQHYSTLRYPLTEDEWLRLNDIIADHVKFRACDAASAFVEQYFATKTINDVQNEYIDTLFGLAERWRNLYAKYKRDNHVIDYDDMEKYMLQLLDIPDVQQEIRESYKFLFVDEFQDCSPIQVKIFDKLSDLMEHSYWVGDYKQSIYGFRGSDIELVKAITDKIRSGENGCRMAQPLDTSYRSERNIVEVANEVFVPAFASQLAEEEVRLKCSTENSTEGNLHLWLAQGSKEDSATKVAKRIAEMVRDGIFPKDIAVLARSRNDFKALAQELSRYHIPLCYDEGNVNETREKQLLFALLQLVAHPDDNLAKAQVDYLTNEGSTIANIIDKKLRFDQSHEENQRFLDDNPLLAELKSHDDYFGLPVSVLVQKIITDLDLYGVSLKWDSSIQGFATLRSLIDLAFAYEEHCKQLILPATINGFINHVENLKPKVNGDPEGVHLFTMHGSKGLEWKCVILLSLDQNLENEDENIRKAYYGVRVFYEIRPSQDELYPKMTISLIPWLFGASKNVPEIVRRGIMNDPEHYYEKAKANRIEEEKRLLYVAMTRPAQHMVLTAQNKTAPFAWFASIGHELDAPQANVTTMRLFEHDFQVEDLNGDFDEQCIYCNDSVIDKRLKRIDQPATSYEQRDLSPSKLPTADNNCEVLCNKRINDRINLDSKQFMGDMDMMMIQVGKCIHQIFCTYDRGQSPNAVCKIIEQYSLTDVISKPNQVVTAWEKLCAFLTEKYGPATQIAHELPFKQEIDGQIVTGEIDMLWRTDKGTVLIDFKTYPGKAEENILNPEDDHYVGKKYFGQINYYANALESGGQNILARYVYYAVNGLIVGI